MIALRKLYDDHFEDIIGNKLTLSETEEFLSRKNSDSDLQKNQLPLDLYTIVYGNEGLRWFFTVTVVDRRLKFFQQSYGLRRYWSLLNLS